MSLVVEAPTTLLVPPFTHTMGFHRVTRFYIQLYLGRDFKIDNPQGMCGAKMIEEDDPATGRDDHILTLFTVNSGTGQILYNVRLTKPGLYGSTGSDTGQFRNPHGICCNPEGDVYVADTDNDRIARLHYEKEHLSWVSALDSGLKRPRGVDVDSRGRVYVADTDNDRVVVYDPEGGILSVWTEGLDRPTAVSVLDADAEYNEFELDAAAVIDHDQTRISQFSLSGQLRRQIDSRRLGRDEAGFAYCAFDRHGNLYVTDQLNSEVHVFDPNLKYIVSQGGRGKFDSPRGLTIWRRFGQFFVNEVEGGQYYWLGLDAYLIGFYPSELTKDQPGTTIALYVTEMGDVTVTIADEAGKPVRTLTPPHFQRPGEVLIVWDGRDDSGRFVVPGEYEIKVTVKPTYSRPRQMLRKELIGRVRRLADTEPELKE